jgi:hypothetical protein
MTPGAVLAILVATGEARAPATAAMAAAAAEVVGDQGGVRIVEVSTRGDAEVLRVEREVDARVVVALAWSDERHIRAHLRLHAARTDRWVDRDFAFADADTPPERGRALGFAMASMLPEGDPSLPLATNDVARGAPPDEPPLGRTAVEAMFLAGTGVGGPAGGLGGRLSLERFVTGRVSLGVSLASRLGRIASLGARELTSSLGAGGALWAVAPTSSRALGLALRAELLFLHEDVEHADSTGQATWKSHALLGAGGGVEGTLRLAGPLELVLAAAAELAFGTVDVTVVAAAPTGGTQHIPPARVVADVGLRARF